MGFWIFMFIMDLIIPATMLEFGYYFRNHAPKEINGFIGYRTKRSMKNQETWQFAHHHFGGLWVKWGWVLLVVSIIVMLTVLGKEVNQVGIVGGILCAIQCVLIVGSIYPTECALKETFDEEGNRK